MNNIGEDLIFLRRVSGDTEQIAQTDDKGGRVSRSVWSAWSLLPPSDVWRGSKAGASSTHSIRFARFGSGYAGLGTGAPYPPSVRSCEKIENSGNSRSQVLDYQEIFLRFGHFLIFSQLLTGYGFKNVPCCSSA